MAGRWLRPCVIVITEETIIHSFAFHQNWIGMFKAIPRYHEAAQCWEELGAVLGITRWTSATFNAAIVKEAALLQVEHIRRFTELFNEFGVNGTIQLADGVPTPVSAEALWREGYSEILCDPMMFYEGVYESRPLNTAVLPQIVRSQQDIELYYRIVAEGFDLPPIIEDFVGVMLRMSECIHMVAWLHGEPVGAGTVVECAGVAGIYNVTTLPGARDKGVATALMYALHNRALADGYAGTALASSTMGLPLYRKLGYQQDGYQIVYTLMNLD
jgi:GNAT superfamily N-acetyltransferase